MDRLRRYRRTKAKSRTKPLTTLQLPHIFYKSDGTTKADKADEKETVTVAKGAKTVTTKKSYNGYQALPGTTLDIVRVQKNIISNGLPPQQIMLPTK